MCTHQHGMGAAHSQVTVLLLGNETQCFPTEHAACGLGALGRVQSARGAAYQANLKTKWGGRGGEEKRWRRGGEKAPNFPRFI